MTRKEARERKGSLHSRVSTRSSNRGADKSITVESRISRINEKSVMVNEDGSVAIARLGRIRLVIIQGCGRTRSEWRMDEGRKGDPTENQMRIGVCAFPPSGVRYTLLEWTLDPSTGVGRRGTARTISKQNKQR